VAGIGRALERMSRRINRPNPLSGGETELTRHYAAFATDFRHFMGDAREYTAAMLDSLD
jgi:acyl carrier protein phosphodiesterase